MSPLRIFPLALVLLSLPSAFAGEPGPDEHVRVVAEFDVDGERHYVVEDHGAVQLWKESNGLLTHGVAAWPSGVATGLQPAWSCLADDVLAYIHADDACDGVKTAPDTRVTNGALLDAINEIVHEIEHEVEHEIEELLP